MQQKLANILERKVDLVSKRAIDRSHNEIRRREILETAKIIGSKEILTREAFKPQIKTPHLFSPQACF